MDRLRDLEDRVRNEIGGVCLDVRKLRKAVEDIGERCLAIEAALEKYIKTVITECKKE